VFRTYLSIQHGYILDVGIVDIVFHSSILANTSHTNSMSTVAIYIFDKNIRRVWFRTEAVIANVDPGIPDCQAVYIVGIPAIGIFGKIL
jgi:hypothetical protein